MSEIDVTESYTEDYVIRNAAHSEKDYKSFLNRLYFEINRCIVHMEGHCNRYQDSGEDDISHTIVVYLNALRYNCGSEKNSNGHVDITVEENDFKWLAEAKIQKGVDWTEHGFRQLTENYSTGRPNANHGGLIVYSKLKKKNNKKCADEWRQWLETSDIDVDCKPYQNGYFDFTVKEHPRSGMPYHIRSFFINLRYVVSKEI